MPKNNLNVWQTDPRWVFDPLNSFTGNEKIGDTFTVTGGMGWTRATYTILQIAPNFAVGGGFGTQTMVRLSYSPAVAGSSGGQGDLTPGVAPSPIIKLGFIGNSITVGQGSATPAPTFCKQALEAVGTGGRIIDVTNQGVSGSTTADWQPSGANLSNAKSAFSSAGATHVLIMLGTNDTRIGPISPAQYGINLGAICANLVTAGYKVVLNQPPYAVVGAFGADAASNARLVSYQAQIASLVNGTTILQGDTSAYSYFQAHQDEFADGLHPNTVGAGHLGQFWATGFDVATTPDIIPPATPTGLSADMPGSTLAVPLLWQAVGDAALYRVRLAGVLVGSPAAPSLSVQQAVNTLASYTVSAVDAAGNESPDSAPFTVSTIVSPYAPLPAAYTGWVVLAIDADDFGGIPMAGITVTAKILPGLGGRAPFSINGTSFQVDAVTYSDTATALGLDATAYPDEPKRRYLLIPPQPLVRDRSGLTNTRVRFDSIGMPGPGGEMIQARILELTAAKVAAANGSLCKLLEDEAASVVAPL